MGAHGFGEVADRLRRATVSIETQGGRSKGSGVIWSADGAVVTNAHVAASARAMVTLWDGQRIEAQRMSRDPLRDLAALRLSRDGLPAARFRDSGTVRPGEIVIAAGNPLGFIGALSTGVVHAVGEYQGLGRKTWIQAAVRLAPGNSGGPLADAEGNVIGINTIVANGLGLAIPSNTLARFMEAGAHRRRQIGVTVRPVPLRTSRQPGVGLAVLEVSAGSPAEAAALRAGDLLIGIDGRPFESLDDLGDALEMATTAIRLEFVRPPQSRIRETRVRVV